MTNKLKRIACGLLSAMMLSTSCGIAALAEDTDAKTTSANTETAAATEAPKEGSAENTEATEAPQATEEANATAAPAPTEAVTEAPEATEAPAVSNYDNDNTYQAALSVCSALGIITGYEDGSIKPEATVTRAEMATIILRMLKLSETDYKNVFLDVASDHWAAGIIQTAVEQAIVDGMGDGTFVPEGNVKYEQVIKMIVAAMGYATDAEMAGGYPNGYISVGSSSLSLLKGVKGMTGEDMPRGEVIKAAYNALMAPFRTVTGTKNGQPIYESKNTLGVEKFNLYEEDGIVVSTPNGTITSGVQKKSDRMTIDGVQYKVGVENADQYLGTKVKFYYIDTNADDPEVVAIVSSGKSTEVTINADDIDTMSVYGTNGETAGTLTAFTSKTSSATKKYKINDVTVIYNGSVLTAADYAAAGKTESYDEFIKPSVGSVKIVDYDADGVYDILFADSYETMLVTTVTTDKLNGKINNANATLNLENDANDKTITVMKSGNPATAKNLRKNDVVSLKRNIDESIIELIVTGETITGKINGVATDGDEKVITVNGEEYKVDKNAEDSITNGMTAVLYLDAFNRVGFIESSTGGNLSEGEKYAVIVNAYEEDDGEISIKLFNQDGEAVILKPSGNMKYWAPGATEVVTGPSGSTLVTDLNSKATAGFVMVGSSPARLCKYAVNSKGEITKLYVAIDKTKATDSDALTLYNGNLRGVTSVGTTVNSMAIPDGIVQFTIPDDAADRADAANYSIGTVSASTYVNYENGSSKDYTVGDFVNGNKAQVLLAFEGGSNTVSRPDYTGNASNGPTLMVSAVNEAVDANGETVFEVQGYVGGNKISYTTAVNTGVYKFEKYNPDYTGDLLFDATDSKYDIDDFMEAVKPGDIFHVGASGSTLYALVKMVDAEDVAASAVKNDETQWQTKIHRSSTRDTWYGGFVDNVDINDFANITIKSLSGSFTDTVPYDVSAVFSYCTIDVDSEGNIVSTKVSKSGGIEPSEIIYGDTSTMDYGLFKMFRGALYDGYIIRVNFVD